MEVKSAADVLRFLENMEMNGIDLRKMVILFSDGFHEDVVICVDLLFQKLGLDLGEAVKDKFNLSSENNNLKTRIY